MSLYNLFWKMDKCLYNGKTLRYCLPYFKEYNTSSTIKHIIPGNYNEYGYKRIPILSSSRLEMVCILWTPYSKSPIHAHESECMYKNIDGFLKEDKYNMFTDNEYVSQKHILDKVNTNNIQKNDVILSENQYEYHRLENISSQYAITLHCYSRRTK